MRPDERIARTVEIRSRLLALCGLIGLTLLTACGAREAPPDPEEPLNVWTWISGSQTTWQAGAYGTKGTAAASNVPGARRAAASWIDSQGRFWLFGGDGRDSVSSGVLNDLWMFDPRTSLWTWISGSDQVGEPSDYGTMGVAAPTNVPGARFSAACWTDDDDRLWLFGGYGNASPGSFGEINDLWVFDPASGLWTWMAGPSEPFQAGTYGTKGTASPSNYPGAREGAASWRSPDGHVWIFGGFGYDEDGWSSVLNDLWRLDESTLEWTWVSGDSSADQLGVYGTKGTTAAANVPGARTHPTTWIDPQNRLWLLGGTGWGASFEGNVYLLNDLWMYAPESGLWTWIAGSDEVDEAGVYGTMGAASPSNIVGARQASASWVAPDGRLWLFGGDGNAEAGMAGFLSDLWMFDPLSGLWTWIGGSRTPNARSIYGAQGLPAETNLPGSRSSAAVWVNDQGHVWIFGGYGYGTGLQYSGALNDLWRYVR